MQPFVFCFGLLAVALRTSFLDKKSNLELIFRYLLHILSIFVLRKFRDYLNVLSYMIEKTFQIGDLCISGP